MAIQIQKNDDMENVNRSFPRLMISIKSGIIYFMRSETHGIIVYHPNIDDFGRSIHTIDFSNLDELPIDYKIELINR